MHASILVARLCCKYEDCVWVSLGHDATGIMKAKQSECTGRPEEVTLRVIPRAVSPLSLWHRDCKSSNLKHDFDSSLTRRLFGVGTIQQILPTSARTVY